MTGERYHAFDALRGAMMLLGVVLHSATMYSTVDGVWWMKDPQTGQWADALIVLIHSFRLPAFFVMAGFFACLLRDKRGWQAMIENRMARLGLPFLIAMITIYPVLKMVSVLAHFDARGPEPLRAAWDWLARGRFNETLEPGHMWFLETLLWTILAALAASRWLDRLQGGWFQRLLMRRGGWALMALFSLPTLLLTEAGILDTPKGFSPHWHVVASYFVFFAFGWGLWLNRESLHSLRRGGAPEMLAATVMLLPVVGALMAQLAERGTRLWLPYAATALLSSLMAWLMIYGLLGLFLRHFGGGGRIARYLSDSAYWVYLMHPVALVAAQYPMRAWDAPAGVKFLAGILWAVPVLYLSYDAWVRPSWIGVLLNGRRAEPVWPDLARRWRPRQAGGQEFSPETESVAD